MVEEKEHLRRLITTADGLMMVRLPLADADVAGQQPATRCPLAVLLVRKNVHLCSSSSTERDCRKDVIFLWRRCNLYSLLLSWR